MIGLDTILWPLLAALGGGNIALVVYIFNRTVDRLDRIESTTAELTAEISKIIGRIGV